MLMLAMTKHEMYDILKARTINLCTDIYGDLGKCIKTILEEQDHIFKTLACNYNLNLEQSLKLCHMEYEAK